MQNINWSENLEIKCTVYILIRFKSTEANVSAEKQDRCRMTTGDWKIGLSRSARYDVNYYIAIIICSTVQSAVLDL